jgi:hypothetical protein
MRGSLRNNPKFTPITIYRVVRKRSRYGVKELVLVGPCKELDNTLVHIWHIAIQMVLRMSGTLQKWCHCQSNGLNTLPPHGRHNKKEP